MPDQVHASDQQIEAMADDVNDLVERMRKVYPDPLHALVVMANAMGVMAAHACVKPAKCLLDLPNPRLIVETCCRFHNITIQKGLIEFEEQMKEIMKEVAKRASK